MNTLERELIVHPIAESRISEVDMNNLPFGRIFSDHMLLARYENGKWGIPEILPYGPIQFAPSMLSLHYGQAIFEGMKASRSAKGEAVLFRAIDNLRRLNQSALRMSMPELPEALFMEGLRELVRIDKAWIPAIDKGSLYIRPVMFASDESIGVRASESYIFSIMTCPVGPYYSEPVSLMASKDYVRASIGGTGAAKCAGNYAGSLFPDKIAKAHGYHNVLWLDAREHRYVEECGTMNIFFVIDDVVITPPLGGTILPGITRHSLLQLYKDHDFKVEVRPLSIYEVQSAWREGRVQEAFGVGTAATVIPIERIGFGGEDMHLPVGGPKSASTWVKKMLENIKLGLVPDPYNWIETV